MTDSRREALKDLTIYPPLFALRKGAKCSYLLGTRHTLPLDYLPAEFIAIINRCQSAVVESVTNITLEGLYRAEILLTEENTSWMDQLSVAPRFIFKELATQFFQRTFKIAPPFNFINPALAHLICYFTYRPKQTMDNEIRNAFVGKVWGLEGSERYADLKDQKISLSELENLLRSLKKVNRSLLNLNEIDYLTGKGGIEYQPVDITLGPQRNLRWLSRMIDYHDTLPGDVLFAVGAAHLPGALGLLNLLKGYGFEITRINRSGIPELFPLLAEYPDSAILHQIERKVDDYAAKEIREGAILPPKCNELIAGYVGPLFYQQARFVSQRMTLARSADGSDVQIDILESKDQTLGLERRLGF